MLTQRHSPTILPLTSLAFVPQKFLDTAMLVVWVNALPVPYLLPMYLSVCLLTGIPVHASSDGHDEWSVEAL